MQNVKKKAKEVRQNILWIEAMQEDLVQKWTMGKIHEEQESIIEKALLEAYETGRNEGR